MAEKRIPFSADAYRLYWQPVIRVIYGISGIVNLILIWQMFFDLPVGVQSQEIPATMWYGPLFFLMLINTAGLAGYGAYRFYKFQKLGELSHVTLADGAVVHYIQEPFMSDEVARMAAEGNWRGVDSQEYYAAYLKFRITQVTKLSRSRRGAILLEGVIERTYHDEYLQIEEGNGYTVMTVYKHKIPSYFKDMDAIYNALKSLEGLEA